MPLEKYTPPQKILNQDIQRKKKTVQGAKFQLHESQNLIKINTHTCYVNITPLKPLNLKFITKFPVKNQIINPTFIYFRFIM